MYKIKKIIPFQLKQFIIKMRFLPEDVYGYIFNRSALIPPKSYIYTIGGNFLNVGEEFKNHFISLCGLKPEHTVLDIGCGIGRMAVPLTSYLVSGKYFGFDIDKPGVSWCSKHITPRFPNFIFHVSDIFNKYYNPKGKISSIEYIFPYNDNSFDFVYLTSVFTHMYSADIDHYMSEIRRVLKPGGQCLATFFVYNNESKINIEAGRSSRNFIYAFDDYYTAYPENPEHAIAFDESHIRSLFNKYSLKIKEPIQFGSWSGRLNHLSFQDIIIAVKE